MRRDGSLPYSWLADNTRWQRKSITFRSVEEALRDTARLYRKDLWHDARFAGVFDAAGDQAATETPFRAAR